METGIFGYCNVNKGAGKREKWQRDDKIMKTFAHRLFQVKIIYLSLHTI